MLALVCCGLLWIGPGRSASGPWSHQEAGGTESAPRSPRALEKLRESLRALPAEKRARFERRLDEFEQLPPQVRGKLLERARALREHERSVDGSLKRELFRRLEELDAERARELWVAHLRERFRERGRELRERLPEDLRQRLERAPPEARRRFLERLFLEREPVSRKALERMRERLGLSGREIQRLERLPLLERLHAMREMRSRGTGGAEWKGG